MQGNSSTRRRGVRGLIWIAIASILAVTMLGLTSAAVLGVTTTLNQTPPILSTDPDFQGDEEECEGVAGPGEVVWHFVLAGTDANSGTLTANFMNEGQVVQFSNISPGKTIHWYVTTDSPDTLEGASADQTGNRLNLSHICQGETTTTTTQTTTQTTTTETTTGTETSGTTTVD
jgi:hypothetical protein